MGEIQTHSVVFLCKEEGFLAPGGGRIRVDENLHVVVIKINKVYTTRASACDKWKVFKVKSWQARNLRARLKVWVHEGETGIRIDSEAVPVFEQQQVVLLGSH